MKEGYIAVIDSGIGGLGVLQELIKSLPNEKFIYYGDNRNAPYGNRTKADLLDLAVNIVNSLLRYNLRAVVLACNTLSVSVLSDLRYYFPRIRFFGVFPPVEILTIRKRKTLLLCTPNTSKRYKNSKYLTVLPLRNLAEDIEKNLFSLEKVDLKTHINDSFRVNFDEKSSLYSPLTTKNSKIGDQPPKYPFEAVILGCTHYFYIKRQIINHFRPPLIVRGEIFTVRKVKKIFQNTISQEKYKGNRVLFVGDCAVVNEKVFNYLIQNSKKF